MREWRREVIKNNRARFKTRRVQIKVHEFSKSEMSGILKWMWCARSMRIKWCVKTLDWKERGEGMAPKRGTGYAPEVAFDARPIGAPFAATTGTVAALTVTSPHGALPYGASTVAAGQLESS